MLDTGNAYATRDQQAETGIMAKVYTRPTLNEYGSLETLTLGSGGTKPDFDISSGTLVLINSTCDASAPATACLIVGS